MTPRRKNTLITSVLVIGALTAGLFISTVANLFQLGDNGFGALLQATLPLLFGLLAVITIGLLASALLRRSKILKHQFKTLKRQSLELDLQRKALDAHAMVVVTNPDGIISSVNQKFCDVWGCDEDQIVGQSVTMIYPKGGDNSAFQEVHSALISGQMWTGETPMVTARGERLLMQGTHIPMYDENGFHTKNVSVRTDITKLRKSENAHFLKDLLDNLHDEVYIFELDGLAIRYMNLRALDRCGWTAADLAGKRILDTDPKFHEPLFRKHVEPLLSGKQDYVTIQARQAKGPVEIRTRLYTGQDGQKLFLSVLRDTTERAQIERARLESVSMVSHELRTPLTSIKGALRLLQSGALGELSDHAKPVVDIADRNSDRLLLIVNDILDLEKIRAGKEKFILKRTDLVPFLHDAVSMNQGYADEHGIALKFQSDLTEAWADIEEGRMMQVMSNLISNAVKYSPDGGTVWIDLEYAHDSLRIGVRDAGPGIPADKCRLIFESFTQLDSPDGRERNGTGLGLAITKVIVKSHDGRINVKSKLGAGSTFFVDLPPSQERDNVVPISTKTTAVA